MRDNIEGLAKIMLLRKYVFIALEMYANKEYRKDGRKYLLG